MTVGVGSWGEARMENGRPLHATMNSLSPHRPRLKAVSWFGLAADILTSGRGGYFWVTLTFYKGPDVLVYINFLN